MVRQNVGIKFFRNFFDDVFPENNFIKNEQNNRNNKIYKFYNDYMCNQKNFLNVLTFKVRYVKLLTS